MGLRATIAAAVMAAFKAIDDIAVNCVYTSISGQPVIDIDAGMSTAPTTDHPIPRVAFTKLKEVEYDNSDVISTDMKMLFPKVYLPVEPNNADYITDPADGRVWQVKQVYLEPSRTLIVLRVRAS